MRFLLCNMIIVAIKIPTASYFAWNKNKSREVLCGVAVWSCPTRVATRGQVPAKEPPPTAACPRWSPVRCNWYKVCLDSRTVQNSSRNTAKKFVVAALQKHKVKLLKRHTYRKKIERKCDIDADLYTRWRQSQTNKSPRGIWHALNSWHPCRFKSIFNVQNEW